MNIQKSSVAAATHSQTMNLKLESADEFEIVPHHASSAAVFTPQQLEELRHLFGSKDVSLDTAVVSRHITGDMKANMAGISFDGISNVENYALIIDTGATNHMTSNKSWLCNLRLNTFGFHSVCFPNSHSSIFSYIGDYVLDSTHLLHDVLLVPDFQYNLISISKFTTDLATITLFYPDRVIFQDLSSGRLTWIGRVHGGLYIWMDKKSDSAHAATLPSTPTPLLQFLIFSCGVVVWVTLLLVV